MSIFEKVKTSLRISHSKLDDEIADFIKAARADMIRSGISADKANDEEDELITSAIRTYCKGEFTDDEKKVEGFRKSYEYQIDNLRKSEEYRRKSNV